jgi:hypothetical protein
VITSAVLPIVEMVNLQTYSALLGAGGIPTTSSQCNPLEICSSGSAELCPGLEGVEIHFTNCGALNSAVSGVITFLGNASQGCATLSLDLNGAGVVGSTSYTLNEQCFSQIFNDITITLPELTMNLQGIAEYCNPTTHQGVIVPSFSELVFTLPDLNRSVQVYSEEEVGNYTVHVTDANQSTVLMSCNGNLFGGMSCHPIEMGLGL